MSKCCLYVIFDKLAEEAGPVFTAKNDQVAIRQYSHMVASQKVNEVDYDLYRIGNYDTESMAVATELVKIPFARVLKDGADE